MHRITYSADFNTYNNISLNEKSIIDLNYYYFELNLISRKVPIKVDNIFTVLKKCIMKLKKRYIILGI